MFDFGLDTHPKCACLAKSLQCAARVCREISSCAWLFQCQGSQAVGERLFEHANAFKNSSALQRACVKVTFQCTSFCFQLSRGCCPPWRRCPLSLLRPWLSCALRLPGGSGGNTEFSILE